MRLTVSCVVIGVGLAFSGHLAHSDDRYCHQYASITSDIAAEAIRQNPACEDFSRGVHSVYDMHYSWCMQNSRSTVDGAADHIRRLANECTGGYSDSGQSQDAQWVHCANENEYCDAPPGATVSYGADGIFVEITDVRDGTPCGNEFFGDPVPGVVKSCFYWSP